MKRAARWLATLVVILGLGFAQQGKLVIATGQDPQSWDPIDTFLLAWGMVGSNIFDGLLDRGTDLKLKPGLATKWEYRDNGKTLRFTLRQGVKFHNGEPFDAAAVKFTFDRLLGDEGAKGPQQANYTAIKEAKVVDTNTVDLIMDRPDPVLITKLAGYGAMIVPPKYIKEKGDAYFNTHPVGTGPFKFVDYAKDQQLSLEANADYWGGKPKVAQVVYRFIEEPATRIAELQAGRVDVAQGVPVAQADVIKKAATLNLVPVGSPTVNELRFATDRPPTNNPKVRQAIIMAVDRDTIIKSILQNYAKPIASFQTDMSFGFDENLKAYPFDPTKAKALLAEAKVAPGTELEINFVSTDATNREVVQAVAGYLQAVGFKISLKPYEVGTFFNDIIPKNKNGQMYYMGWGGWTLDFDNTAYLLYRTGEFWNPVFSDKTVDKLLDDQRATSDQSKREKILQQIAKYLYDIAIEMPLYQSVNLWGVNKRVQGFVAPADDRIRLLNVSVQ